MLDLKTKFPQLNLNTYRSCFFAYPFQDNFHILRDWLSGLLLQNKYGIKLITPSLEISDSIVIDDIKTKISQCHFGIADITGNNPNVIWELGLMMGYGKEVIIIKQNDDQTKTPFDLYGNFRIEYHVAKDNTGHIEYSLLENGLNRHLKRIFQKLPELNQAQIWRAEQ